MSEKHYCFFQNRDCEFFPCHENVEESDFNCLFCYCPLYTLGEACGGGFVYTEKGVKSIGLSGNKAQHLDLTVELGFSSDMGATNSRYPEEICEGQRQMKEGSMMGLTYDKLDVSAEDMEDVDLYLHSLGVPARRLGSTTTKVTLTRSNGTTVTMTEREAVQRGEKMFFEAKCHLCHVTTLHTRPRGATLLCGTEGIGLQKKVNGHTYFLHDGRARNFKEAILWHGGEGLASRNLFMKMDRADRDAMIKFLESL